LSRIGVAASSIESRPTATRDRLRGEAQSGSVE
jgi:hypothetical protein